ncbi:3-oxoacyl-ACP synthase [Klebsiella sp. RIT-PI-d]|uniref:beta-ketoacyl-ACP synthase II n=1 Tax=Klebsiella sp. RIT-PI-d TaxID=1681196 RepID=UPI0006761642|nr:beta-ketoacyl-ACP synthase II [Klebsiella sp. RIT-PI-d]KNC11138.1 3-oxoacyl-ACP synthase [Klebsiella sp. RIT-PI-d]
MKETTRKRIVITGMGIVSPLGCGVDHVWKGLINGCSGIRLLPEDITDGTGVAIGGLVPSDEDDEAGLNSAALITAKERKKIDRFTEYALVAAEEALAQANWYPQEEEQRIRTATVIATGIGGFSSMVDAVRITDSRGPGRLSPFTVPSFLPNMAAGNISIHYGFKGPLGAPVTACAASVQAIGDAARMIISDEADIAVCGGTEAALNRVTLGGFAAARALSTRFNVAPHSASRPFDADRDGFVMADGAGILVIESLDHALARGAIPIAELTGYGTSADAYHLTAGPADGNGAKRAMIKALKHAGLSPDDIQYINAHATSTPTGDRCEIAAIKGLFGASNSVAVSSTKSATGHMLGAAGGVEAIFTVLSLLNQIAPPTLNLFNPDPDADGIDFIRHSARNMAIDNAMSNGFGFGGVNASVIFRRWIEL